MRRLVSFALVAVLGVVTGCGGCDKEPGRVTVELNDEHNSTRGQVPLTQGFAQLGEGPTAIRVDVRDSRMTVNGKDGGEVKAGDTIRVEKDGRVTVNGQKRELK